MRNENLDTISPNSKIKIYVFENSRVVTKDNDRTIEVINVIRVISIARYKTRFLRDYGILSIWLIIRRHQLLRFLELLNTILKRLIFPLTSIHTFSFTK